MFDQNIILFSVFMIAGLFIFLLRIKFSNTTRKVIETIGAVIFHMGVFGIIYHHVSLSLFISLFAFVIALFILWDPLNITNHVNEKVFKLFGYLALCTSIAFGLQSLTGFPVWPWIIPIIIYLAPYLISPLKKFNKLIVFISWGLVFVYALTIGLVIYGVFAPDFDTTFISKHFSQKGYLEQFSKQNPKPKKEKTEDFNQADISENKIQPKQKEQKTPVQIKKFNKKTEITNQEKEQNRNSIKEATPKKITKPVKEPVKKATPVNTTQNQGPYLKSLQEADKEYLKLKKNHDTLRTKYNELIKKNIELEQEIKELKDVIVDQ